MPPGVGTPHVELAAEGNALGACCKIPRPAAPDTRSVDVTEEEELPKVHPEAVAGAAPALKQISLPQPPVCDIGGLDLKM